MTNPTTAMGTRPVTYSDEDGAIAASGTGALAVPVEPQEGLAPTGFDHTIAGPWSFSEVRYRWDMVDRRNIYDANGEFVCMVIAPSNAPSERDHLIAAAPEMLRVLKEVAEGFGLHNDVLDVIAKAQGEA